MSYHPAFTGSPIDPDGFSSPYEGRPRFQGSENRPRTRNLSPSVRGSGEDILRKLKEELKRGAPEMFFNECFLTPEAMFAKADEGDDSTLRGRHPHHQGFRVPSWMSEDQDMKDLATRMSHAPHFATMGRRGGTGGPWRERRHSGGSAMSGTSEDDSYDPAGAADRSSQCSGGSCEISGVPHEIPIRFEAPPPPSQQQEPPTQPQEAKEVSGSKPLRTTSAVDASEQGNSSSRASRCASAPPEMAEQQMESPLPQQQQQQPQPQQQQQQQPQQRFVSKISITPQTSSCPQSPQFSPLPAKFNTIPRPFVSGDSQQTQQQYPQQQQPYPPQQQQYPPQQQPYPPQQQPYPPQQQPYPPQQQQYPPQQQPYPPQQQQYPPQPPLGFFPPPDPQWQFSQQQQQQQPQQQAQQEAQGQRGTQRPSVVRNIPIFVEGRDEPLEQDTKPAPPWTQTRTQPPAQPQPRPQAPTQPQPRPQAPAQPQPRPQPQPQPTPRQKRQQAHQPTPPPQQPIPHPVPMPMPEPHPAAPTQAPPQQPHVQEEAAPQHAPTPPPAQPAKDLRLVQIERVSGTVAELSERVNTFCGTKRDKDFLFLDEMLTRALLQLDNVDPDGCDEVRKARRVVIKSINTAICNLENRAKDQPAPAPAPASPQPAAPTQDPQPSQGPQQDPPLPSQQELPPESVLKENAEEKMDVIQQQPESTRQSKESAEGGADPPPPQPEVSSS